MSGSAPLASLDVVNRKILLETAEYIGAETGTNIVFITRSEKEILPGISKLLILDAGKTIAVKRTQPS